MKVIDLHIHGGFGICFDNAEPDDIRNFARRAYAQGIAAFCPTLTGDKPEKLRKKIEIINEAKKSQKNAKDEALIIGAHLEGTFLNPKKSGVQNPETFIEPTVENFQKIEGKTEGVIKIAVIAPESRNCAELIKYLKSKNIKVHFGHTMTEEIAGADGICHLFNGMEPITHKKNTGAIKALLSESIYTELIADGVHVCPDILRLVFKVRPKNKIILISDALPIAHAKADYVEFCGKKIYKNGKDEFNTLGGSVKFLPEIVEHLDKSGILPLEEAKKMAYDNPKNYLKLIV